MVQEQPEALRAVQPGSLERLGRDGLQPDHEQQRVHTGRLPGHRDDHHQRVARTGLQPAGVRTGQPEEPECLAERAVRLQHEAPDDTDGHTGDRVRQQERQPQPRAPLVPVGQYGDQQPEHHRERHHADHPQQRVDQRPHQVRVAEHRLVVGQPGPHRRREAVVVGEADVRRPQERQVEQQRDHGRGRQPEQRGRPATVPRRDAARTRRLLHRRRSLQVEEVTSAWPSTRPPRPGSSAGPASGRPAWSTNAPNTSSALFATGTGVASNQRLISR